MVQSAGRPREDYGDEIGAYLSKRAQQKVREEAQKQNVPVDFAERIGNRESRYKADVISGAQRSKAGAIGTMQLMPRTARGLKVDPLDFNQNIEGGVRYAKELLDRYRGDQRLAAVGYNAGPKRADEMARTGELPNISETRGYVAEVAPQGEDHGAAIESYLIQRGLAVAPLQDEQTVTTATRPANPVRDPNMRGPRIPLPAPNPFNWKQLTQTGDELTRAQRPTSPKLKDVRVDLKAARQQLQQFSAQQPPAPTREQQAAAFQAMLAQHRSERETRQKQLEAEGQRLSTAERTAAKLALPASEMLVGAYSLPATMLRTNPNIDPDALEKTLGGYGRSVDAAQETLREHRVRADALPADASLLEKGAGVAADVVGNLVPVVVGSWGMSPVAAAGGAGFLQTIGQGGKPTEAAKEAAFGAAGAAAGAGAERLAHVAVPRLASSRFGRQVAGRTITGAAGAGAGLLEADLRDLNEQQAATATATNAALSTLFYGGGRPTAEKAKRPSAAKLQVDKAAHEAATSPLNDLPQPTAAQKEAGNFRQGHLRLHGLDISIEQPKGSKRAGVAPDGKPWEVEMSAHYGNLRRTTGADGEAVDVYIGAHPESERVFIVDQVNAENGKFDEHKAILGVKDLAAAERLYDAHFSDGKGPDRRGAVTEMSVAEFKQWLKEGGGKKPLALGQAPRSSILNPRSSTATEPPAPKIRADAPFDELRGEWGALHRRLNEPDANRAELHDQLDAIEHRARQLVNERMPDARATARDEELQRLLLAGQDADTVVSVARRKTERAGRDIDGPDWERTEREMRALLDQERRHSEHVAELNVQLNRFGDEPPPPSRREEWRQWWDTKEAEARQRLKQRFAPNVTHDLTDIAAALPDLAMIGSAKMAKGSIQFADWSEAMLREYGEDIRPHLRMIFSESYKLHAEAHPTSRATLQRQLSGAQQAQQAAQSNLAKRLTRLDQTSKLETLSALRKAGLLTGVKTHLRNIGGNTLFQAVEELSRVPASIADLAVSAVTKQRTITGLDPLAVARSAREAATRGVREAWETLKHGAPLQQQTRQQLREIRSGSRLLDAYVNGVFRTLSAEDRLFKTYAYTRALEDRARAQALTEVRQGRLESNRNAVAERTRELVAQPSEAMIAEAIGDAEVATFNNPNRAAEALQAGRQKLGAGGRFALDLAIPFSNTPSNVIARTLEYAGWGYAQNVRQLADAVVSKAFTPQEQRAFAQSFGRATTGAGLITLGWKLAAAGLMTGLAAEDPRDRERNKLAGRPPLALRVGDRWLQLGAFAPVAPLLGIGASLYEASHGQAQKPAEELAGTAGKVLLEQPMLRGTKEITDALSEPGKLPDKAGRIAGSFVPTIVSDAGAALDTVQRQPRGFVQQMQNRLPVLREQLPPKTDAFGQPLETRATDFFDPFLTRRARESDSPLASALTRLGVGLTPPQKRRNEKPEAYAERRAEVGRLFNQHGAELLASEEWREAGREERKAALAYLLSEAKRQSGRELKESRLTPGALLEGGRKRRKQDEDDDLDE